MIYQSFLFLFVITVCYSALANKNPQMRENKTNNTFHSTQNHQNPTLDIEPTSHTLIVQTALKTWTLTYSKKQVAINGYMMDLSLKRKKCNTHIIDRFNKTIQKIIKTNQKHLTKNLKLENQTKETLQITLDGKIYFTNGRLKPGAIFLSLPGEILRMKWEENLNCEQKTTYTQNKVIEDGAKNYEFFD